METAQAGVPTLAAADLVPSPDSLDGLHDVRASTPIAWLPEFNGYLVTRRTDVSALVRDRRLEPTNAEQSFRALDEDQLERLAPLRECITMWMGHTTFEGHQRFRMLLKRYFTPAAMEKLRPSIRRIAEELLDRVADAGELEVIKDLAFPLPANVIADMFGMPVEDRPLLPGWSAAITTVFTASGYEDLLVAQEQVGQFQDYLRDLVEKRRAELGDDMISELLRAEDQGRISTEEIVANCVLLLFAGHETTAGLIARGISMLLDNPDQLALLRDHPELGPSAVEEMLRYDGPVNTLVRDVVEPFEYGGHQFDTGDRFFLSVYAANHDPEHIEDPERFDISRPRDTHLAFGVGMFYCLGAALARVETDECLKVFLERIPNPRAAGRPVWSAVQPLGHRMEALPIAY